MFLNLTNLLRMHICMEQGERTRRGIQKATQDNRYYQSCLKQLLSQRPKKREKRRNSERYNRQPREVSRHFQFSMFAHTPTYTMGIETNTHTLTNLEFRPFFPCGVSQSTCLPISVSIFVLPLPHSPGHLQQHQQSIRLGQFTIANVLLLGSRRCFQITP